MGEEGNGWGEGTKRPVLNFFGFAYAIHLKLTPKVKHNILKLFTNFYGDHVPNT